MFFSYNFPFPRTARILLRFYCYIYNILYDIFFCQSQINFVIHNITYRHQSHVNRQHSFPAPDIALQAHLAAPQHWDSNESQTYSPIILKESAFRRTQKEPVYKTGSLKDWCMSTNQKEHNSVSKRNACGISLKD